MAEHLCGGRKCLSRLGFGNGVSKVGPSTPRPPTSESPQANDQLAADRGINWNATTVGAVAATVVAIVIMIVVLFVQRNKRRRNQQMRESVENAGKARQGEANGSKEGQWCAGAVELVVMAGETEPTFLAHPVPTPTVTHLPVIQCPPLVPLPNDHQIPGQSTQ